VTCLLSGCSMISTRPIVKVWISRKTEYGSVKFGASGLGSIDQPRSDE
jgi:hypothetical protein